MAIQVTRQHVADVLGRGAIVSEREPHDLLAHLQRDADLDFLGALVGHGGVLVVVDKNRRGGEREAVDLQLRSPLHLALGMERANCRGDRVASVLSNSAPKPVDGRLAGATQARDSSLGKPRVDQLLQEFLDHVASLYDIE